MLLFFSAPGLRDVYARGVPAGQWAGMVLPPRRPPPRWKRALGFFASLSTRSFLEAHQAPDKESPEGKKVYKLLIKVPVEVPHGSCSGIGRKIKSIVFFQYYLRSFAEEPRCGAYMSIFSCHC